MNHVSETTAGDPLRMVRCSSILKGLVMYRKVFKKAYCKKVYFWLFNIRVVIFLYILKKNRFNFSKLFFPRLYTKIKRKKKRGRRTCVWLWEFHNATR